MEKKATGDSKLNDSPVYYLLENMDFYKNNYLWLHCMNIEEQQTVKKLCEELLSGLKMSKKLPSSITYALRLTFRNLWYDWLQFCICLFVYLFIYFI